MMLGLLTFVGVALAVICTPGPDTVLTIRNASSGGCRSGVWTAVGVGVGQIVWTVAASFGIAGLLRASEPVFLTMKVVGAAYLIYLGCRLILSEQRPAGETDLSTSTGFGARRSLRQGLVNDLANPKMVAFFSSLLPQFAPTDGRALPVMLALGMIFSGLTVLWLSAYSLAFDKLSRRMKRTRVRSVIDRIGGVFLIAFGVRVVTLD